MTPRSWIFSALLLSSLCNTRVARAQVTGDTTRTKPQPTAANAPPDSQRVICIDACSSGIRHHENFGGPKLDLLYILKGADHRLLATSLGPRGDEWPLDILPDLIQNVEVVPGRLTCHGDEFGGAIIMTLGDHGTTAWLYPAGRFDMQTLPEDQARNNFYLDTAHSTRSSSNGAASPADCGPAGTVVESPTARTTNLKSTIGAGAADVAMLGCCARARSSR